MNNESKVLDGSIRVRRTFKGEIDETLDVVDVPLFPEGVSPAYVRYQASFTKQIRQYEPVNVEVSVSIPCLPIDSEINSTLTRAQGFVSERLKEARIAAASAGTKRQENGENDKPY
jgi:hypothetical protein